MVPLVVLCFFGPENRELATFDIQEASGSASVLNHPTGINLPRQSVAVSFDDGMEKEKASLVRELGDFAKDLEAPWRRITFEERNYDRQDLVGLSMHDFSAEKLKFSIATTYHGERYPLPGKNDLSNPSLCRNETDIDGNVPRPKDYILPVPKTCLASRYYYSGFLGIQQTVTCYWFRQYYNEKEEQCRQVKVGFARKNEYSGKIKPS